jgi:hypothetical protein
VLEWYTQPVILAEEPPTLVVSDGSGTGKRFGPGQVDVLIRAGCRISGTVSGNVVEFPDTEPSPEWVSEHRDAILFIDAKRFGELTSNQELMAALFHPDDSPQAIVLVLPPTLTTLPRGVFLTHESYANNGPMLAQATADTAATIRAAGPAAHLTLTSHYRVVEREVPNVVARLHSGGPSAPDDSQTRDASRPAIVLSAHFDGTGDMSANVRYPSAVDNAGGTAVVLELARLLAASQATSASQAPQRSQGAPSTGVWIVFFNGEEQGLYGSRAFVQRHGAQVRDAIVINLDMVGHGDDSPYTLSYVDDAAKLARELAAELNDAGLATTAAQGGGSDHASFEGTARAVSVVQAPYQFMHQQGDVAGVARPDLLARIANVMLRFIVTDRTPVQN